MTLAASPLQAQSVFDAAQRPRGPGPTHRTFADELNAFFAGDALILKLRELAERLRELKDSVKADDVEARMKSARDQAGVHFRDRSDLAFPRTMRPASSSWARATLASTPRCWISRCCHVAIISPCT